MVCYLQKIDWNDSIFLKKFLKESGAGFIPKSIERKVSQLIDYFQVHHLDSQLKWLDYELHGIASKHEKKAKLLALIDGEDGEDMSSDENEATGVTICDDSDNEDEKECIITVNEPDDVDYNFNNKTPHARKDKKPFVTISPKKGKDGNKFDMNVARYNYVNFTNGGKVLEYECHNTSQMDILRSLYEVFGKEAFNFHNGDTNETKRKLIIPELVNDKLNKKRNKKEPNIPQEKKTTTTKMNRNRYSNMTEKMLFKKYE